MAVDDKTSSAPLVRPSSSPLPTSATISSKPINGPHWRPSVNKLLQRPISRPPGDSPLQSKLVTIHSQHESPANQRRSGNVVATSSLNAISRAVAVMYLELPQELRDIIESYLSSTDLLCLTQTCTAQRQGQSTRHTSPAFDPLQSHSLRARLDRDYYHVLCESDNTSVLTGKHAACSFCHTLHPWRFFSQAQLIKPPETRRCTFALRNYLICGNYWLNPTDLRQLLEKLADGRSDSAILHDAPAPLKGTTPSHPRHCIPVSTIIENTPHIARSRSAFSATSSGLTLTHHFHLQSHHIEPLHPAIYRFASALESPRRSVLAICPHLTVNSAGLRLGLMQDVNRGLIGECPEKACGTSFGWFECESETEGWRDLCFKVERGFGWVEELGGEFWRCQTVT